MIEDVPVIDAVVHAYNLDASNYANKWGQPTSELVATSTYFSSKPGYRVPAEQKIRDWGIDETASLVFAESDTDLATYHVLPIGAYRDGMCSVEKAQEAIARWPDRFVVYTGVDPTRGRAAIDEFDRQFELLGRPTGLKLYPNSWQGDDVLTWRMDDPEIAYPLFEHARSRGVKVIAIHKAMPLGPYPLDGYRVDDVDRAAMNFPDIQFEVVHGGFAFIEESAWQLARFPNLFINLEVTGALAWAKPKAWQYALAGLMQVAGPMVLDRIVWGTGAVAYHPQPHLEAFWDFTFDDDVMERFGIPQITRETKAAILGGNYARLLDLDIAARLERIADDEFSKLKAEGLREPYSTTRSAGHHE